MQINSIETELTWLSHDCITWFWRCLKFIFLFCLQKFDSTIIWLVRLFPQRVEFNMTVSDLEVKQRKVPHDNLQV